MANNKKNAHLFAQNASATDAKNSFFKAASPTMFKLNMQISSIDRAY